MGERTYPSADFTVCREVISGTHRLLSVDCPVVPRFSHLSPIQVFQYHWLALSIAGGLSHTSLVIGAHFELSRLTDTSILGSAQSFSSLLK